MHSRRLTAPRFQRYASSSGGTNHSTTISEIPAYRLHFSTRGSPLSSASPRISEPTARCVPTVAYSDSNCSPLKFFLNSAQRRAQFVGDLSIPDNDGDWLFPKLSAMRFELVSFPFLAILTCVVTGRLQSNTAKSIHSVSFRCSSDGLDTVIDSLVNALVLLVPECNVKISHPV